MHNISKFIDGCNELNISLTDGQIGQFIKFYELLVEKNKVMNLTAITEFDEVVTRHFLDSLLIVRIKEFHSAGTIIDMGTGAGFPGIPLKIAFPELDITLADSLNKRIRFLDDSIHELGLNKVHTVHARAEELGKNKDYRQRFDLAVSRAVANLSSLSEYCIPLVKKEGYFVAYKSADIEEEYKASLKAVSLLGGESRGIFYYQLPQTDMERSFVLVKKIKDTPGKYPRKAGTPSKEPL